MAHEEPTGKTGGAAVTAENQPAEPRSANVYVDGTRIEAGSVRQVGLDGKGFGHATGQRQGTRNRRIHA